MEQQPSNLKTHAIYCLAIAAIIVAGYLWNNYRDGVETRDKEKIAASEAREKIAIEEKAAEKAKGDSIADELMKTEAVLEYQKKNPQIIREKYAKNETNIIALSDDESILLLASRVRKGTTR